MFRSPDQALAFAFRIRNSSVISIPSATYIANKTDNESTSDRLTHYDLHAQVGMIFNFLGRRPEMEQLAAIYLHGAIEEQAAAAKKITDKYRSQFQKYRLNDEQIVTAMLGKTVRDVRDKCGLTQHKAWKFRREVADLIQPHMNSLMDSLWNWLQVSEDDVI